MPKKDEKVKNREVEELFCNGEVFNATDKELQRALRGLSTGFVPNAGVRHREIIRGLTINSILSQRHIDRIEARNRLLTYAIITLTGVSIILSILNFLYK